MGCTTVFQTVRSGSNPDTGSIGVTLAVARDLNEENAPARHAVIAQPGQSAVLVNRASGVRIPLAAPLVSSVGRAPE